MVKDAEANAEEDKRKKEIATLKNEADTLVYSVEKSLKDYGEKIPPGEKAEAEEALKRLKDIKDTTSNPEELKKAVEAMTAISHKFAEKMYKEAADAKAASEQQGQPHGEGSGGEGGGAHKHGGGPEEEVVEAEFEDMDNKKKK
jgi:molecular chaperone DnaK